jgi:hypothetical protein
LAQLLGEWERGKFVPAILEGRPSGSELAARAWLSLRRAFAAMPAFYVGTFLIYSLASMLQSVLIDHPRYIADLFQGSAALHSLLYFAGALQSLVSLAAIAVGAVATHRFVLLDDIHPIIGRNTLKFLAWLVALGLIFLLLDVVKSLDRKAMPDSGLSDMIGGMIWVAKAVVAIYFVPLFPSVAVAEGAEGWRKRIETSWMRMDGNFWLFIRGDILAVLPFILALMLAALVPLTFSPLGLAQGRDMSALNAWFWIFQMLRDLAQFPIFMIQAAIASWLYAWVQQQSSLALEPIGHA